MKKAVLFISLFVSTIFFSTSLMAIDMVNWGKPVGGCTGLPLNKEYVCKRFFYGNESQYNQMIDFKQVSAVVYEGSTCAFTNYEKDKTQTDCRRKIVILNNGKTIPSSSSAAIDVQYRYTEYINFIAAHPEFLNHP